LNKDRNGSKIACFFLDLEAAYGSIQAP